MQYLPPCLAKTCGNHSVHTFIDIFTHELMNFNEGTTKIPESFRVRRKYAILAGTLKKWFLRSILLWKLFLTFSTANNCHQKCHVRFVRITPRHSLSLVHLWPAGSSPHSAHYPIRDIWSLTRKKIIDLKLRLVCVYFEEFAFCDIHPLNRKSVQPHMDPECIILILASMYVCECVRRACIHLGNCLWEKS